MSNVQRKSVSFVVELCKQRALMISSLSYSNKIRVVSLETNLFSKAKHTLTKLQNLLLIATISKARASMPEPASQSKQARDK